MQLLK